MPTSQTFYIFGVVIGAELVLFVGFLGWLLVGLNRERRRERRLEAFRESFLEGFVNHPEGGEDFRAWRERLEVVSEEIAREVLLALIRSSEHADEHEQLVDFYRAEGFAEKHLRDLNSPSRGRRVAAMRALIGVARPEDVEEVRDAIFESNIECILAARIAADVGAPEVVVDIFRRIELESRLMEEPVLAVLESMPASDFAVVFDVWESFDSVSVKRVLLRAAGHFPVEDVDAELREAAQSEHLELRTASCDAAARVDSDEARKLLVGLLQDDEPAVRARAATALGGRGERSALEPLQRRLTDSEFWVRQNAATALRRLGPRGVDALREIAAESDDAFAVDAAHQEIGRFESDAGLIENGGKG